MLSNDMMTIGAADASFYAILKLRIKLLLKLVWNYGGQFYKHFAIVIYDFRIVLTRNLYIVIIRMRLYDWQPLDVI